MKSHRLVFAALVLLLSLPLVLPPATCAYNNYRVKYLRADPDEFDAGRKEAAAADLPATSRK